MPTRTQPSTLLSAIAHVLDESLHPEPGNAVVLLSEEPDDPEQVVLALRSLGDAHPCDALAGLTVPDGCWGVALVVRGRAHVLDAPDEPPAAIVTTYLHHRDGRSVSLLRCGDRVTEQPGPVVGRIPDLCARILERCRHR